MNRALPLPPKPARPRDEPLRLTFVVGGRTFTNVVVDTGCENTTVLSRNVAECAIPSPSLEGKSYLLSLGETSVTLPAQMVVLPEIEVQFPGLSEARTSLIIPPGTHCHVLPFSTDVDALVGTNLLPTIFPKSLPVEYYSAASGKAISSRLRAHRAVHDDGTVDTLENRDGSAVEITDDTVPVGSDGEGSIQKDELPRRAVLTTPPEKEAEYAAQRARILNDPRVKAALAINEAITGFCTAPESVVTLKLKPGASPAVLYRRQYGISAKAIEWVTKVVQRWLESGRIEPVEGPCPYNSPLLVADKFNKDGEWIGYRVCLDTRTLNQWCEIIEMFELPLIRELLNLLGGFKIFGEADLTEAYLQFKLAKESRPLTAFTWNGKQYQFVGAPFGLSQMPSFFQRVISYMFSDMPFTHPYIDNLPFASKNWDDHLDMTLAILNRLNSFNLKLNLKLLNIGQASMQCLGHLVAEDGVRPDPSKLDCVQKWELPKTATGMQSFLGLVNFLRGGIRHYADLVYPLHKFASRKDKGEIEASPEVRRNFDLLKRAAQSQPMLRWANMNRPFHVACDASNTGVGGVLYQPATADEQVTPNNIVAMCSKMLSGPALHYPAYRKELYAVVYCLRQFHQYLWLGTDTVVVTDHRPLVYVLKQPRLTFAVQQWLDTILSYRFTVVHRPGVLNVLPDALSRMHYDLYRESGVWGVSNITFGKERTPGNTDGEKLVEESIAAEEERVARLPKVRAVRVKKKKKRTRAARRDGDLGEGEPRPATEPEIADEHIEQEPLGDEPIIEKWQAVDGQVIEPRGGVPPANEPIIPLMPATPFELEKDGQQPEREAKWRQRAEEKGKTFVEPDQRKLKLEQAHVAHFGVKAMMTALEKYYWPYMQRDVERLVHSCHPCLAYNVGRRGFRPARYIVADGPGHHYQVDLATGFVKSVRGYTALLVLVDVFSGFVLLRPLKDKSEHTVARALWELWCIIGVPRVLQSDNGPEFVNRILNALRRVVGFDHRLIAPYNPRADGKVERNVGTVTKAIVKLLWGDRAQWCWFVPLVQLAVNTKIGALTETTPFAIMFNREANELVDYTLETPAVVTREEWKEYQEKVLALIYPAIKNRIGEKKSAMIEAVNRRRKSLIKESLPRYAIVYRRSDVARPGRHDERWVGPYYINEVGRNGTYKLCHADGTSFDRPVPHDQLKVVVKRPDASYWKQTETTVEVGSILAHRGDVGAREYLIHFGGDKLPRWEPSSSIHDHQLIDKYWSALQEMEQELEPIRPGTEDAAESEQVVPERQNADEKNDVVMDDVGAAEDVVMDDAGAAAAPLPPPRRPPVDASESAWAKLSFFPSQVGFTRGRVPTQDSLVETLRVRYGRGKNVKHQAKLDRDLIAMQAMPSPTDTFEDRVSKLAETLRTRYEIDRKEGRI